MDGTPCYQAGNYQFVGQETLHEAKAIHSSKNTLTSAKLH